MNQQQRKQRRQMQVVAAVCREVAEELREAATAQPPEVQAGLKYVAHVQDVTALGLEMDAGGPLPEHRPLTEAERQETRQAVYTAMNGALKSSGAPPEMLQQWGVS